MGSASWFFFDRMSVTAYLMLGVISKPRSKHVVFLADCCLCSPQHCLFAFRKGLNGTSWNLPLLWNVCLEETWVMLCNYLLSCLSMVTWNFHNLASVEELGWFSPCFNPTQQFLSQLTTVFQPTQEIDKHLTIIFKLPNFGQVYLSDLMLSWRQILILK